MKESIPYQLYFASKRFDSFAFILAVTWSPTGLTLQT